MEQDPKRPNQTPRALADKQARAQREAEALRANLRKRKAQSRARQDDAAKPPPGEDGH
jgi:hypothetical protein